MSIKLPGVQTSDIIAFPVRGRPLDQAAHALVQRAIANISSEWSVEPWAECSDDAALILVPNDGDDAVGPSFMICREACGFRVNQVHWDTLTAVGVFTSLNAAITALCMCLLFHSELATPCSMTVH